MSDEEWWQRIVVNSAVMAGKPVIKGTRLTVDFIVGLLANGASVEEIVKEYDGLTLEDINACLHFASRSCPPPAS
jgi:uncharacterized protein (DUF433 family)